MPSHPDSFKLRKTNKGRTKSAARKKQQRGIAKRNVKARGRGR